MSDLQTAKVEFLVQDDGDPFAELFSLPHEVVFFVPSTVNVNQVDLELQTAMVAYVGKVLAEQFGGVTENAPARGGWPSEALGMVYEKVIPITCYIAELTNQVKRDLVNLAKHIKSEMAQESVLIVVDGKGLLV